MRDPERRERILRKLGELWGRMDAQRFGQLLESQVFDPVGGETCQGPGCLHYVEDDEVERRLDKALGR